MSGQKEIQTAEALGAAQYKALLDIYRLSKVVLPHAEYGVTGYSANSSQLPQLHRNACKALAEAVARFEKTVPTINIDKAEGRS